MNETEFFAPYRLVAEFGEGIRKTFDGLTEQQAMQRMEAAQDLYGDIAWYDGVTDEHYTNGVYYKLIPDTTSTVIGIDLTDYRGPLDENGLPPSLTGNPPAGGPDGPADAPPPQADK